MTYVQQRPVGDPVTARQLSTELQLPGVQENQSSRAMLLKLGWRHTPALVSDGEVEFVRPHVQLPGPRPLG